jgi:tetratricopeptide (TPR) repeat protein
MTEATTPAVQPPGGAPARADDVRLARVHLRMGQLQLARAELEDLQHHELLDVTSLAVLAEARWRTGDPDGAADAADAHIAAGGSDDVALCIAAEAAALDGRQDEARELMERLPAADATALDALFAGMPRRAFWPAGPVDRTALEELRRESDGSPRTTGRRAGPRTGGTFVDTGTQGYRFADLLDESGPGHVVGSDPATAPAAHPPRHRRAELDPAAELSLARAELDAQPDRAFLRLALVLRHDPTRASAVLDVLHLRREPTAALLRGDAQRLLGRHLEAEAAFDAAAESLEAS